MVHKKTDPKYGLLRGHIPKALLKRFKNYCLENELDYSQGLEDVVTTFFHLLDKGEILSAKTRTLTIADLIRDWNLEELARLSELPVENLQAILEGQRPSNDDLIGLGIVLCKDNGEPWTTDELVEIRDYSFSYVPDLSKNRDSPRVP
ncbi:hypothetical protein [Allocoleopsis sp.]|uniref:hypothetical protein n=1 Tax=Allocoleopsis sp. TaxID=3088169 RepID=UPI002FD49329